MRHWFLALLVALLPLRGWVGDAMATGILTQQLLAAQASVPHGDGEPAPHADAHPPIVDCHGPAAPADGSDSAQHHCTACNLCHSAVFAPVWVDWQPPAVAVTLPRTGKPHYTSADTAAHLKPPIS